MSIQGLRPALLCLSFLSLAGASPCLTSLDGSLVACFNQSTGQLLSLSLPPSATPYKFTSGGTELENAVRSGSVTVSVTPTLITVSQEWAFLPPAPPGSSAQVLDSFAPSPTSIAWDVRVSAPAGSAAWSVPIATRLAVDPSTYAASKLWAPWDRGSASSFPTKWVDPLQPSDTLPFGWWDGCYVLGSGGTAGGCDVVVAPLVTLLSSDPAAPGGGDTGVTLALSPADLPLDVVLSTRGSDPANASLAFTRSHARLGGGAPTLALHMDLVGHAGDWRASLGWSTRTYPKYWEPVHPEVSLSCSGLGSYSYFGDSPGDSLGPYLPALEAMAYGVNWDLSGRWFPYQGMFLPPVGQGDTWLNDAEGTQPRANVTFAGIGAWYRQMASAGYLDLSYFNINEYGTNIVLPPPSPQGGYPRPSPKVNSANATCVTTWQNASTCMIENFLSAALMSFWATGDRHSRPNTGPVYSWQKSIVVDPGDSAYHDFLLEQLERHILNVDAFAGIVIDRSDWQDQFNLLRDDGLTFLPELATVNASAGVAGSFRVSYATTAANLRATMTTTLAARRMGGGGGRNAAGTGAEAHSSPPPTPLGPGIMLMNTVGNARLDMMLPFDGQFAEGHAVNAVGLLGARAPAVLWTYNAGECCATPTATAAFFQYHIYMGVAPMAPFPGNDHAIAWDVGVAAQYSRYGPLFGGLRGRTWALLPHIVSMDNATSTTPAKVNAFVVPWGGGGGGGGGLQPSLVVAVMLGQEGSGRVGVNVTAWDRVWSSTQDDKHPLLRLEGGAGGGPSPTTTTTTTTAATTYTLEQLTPGVGATWAPLAGFPSFSCGGTGGAACSAVLPVQLVEGCALIRIRL